MSRVPRGAIGLLALALVGSCTAKSKEPTVNFEEAQQRVVALVDDTLSAALPTLPLSQPARVEHQPCDDALGAPSQDVSLYFEREFPLDGPQADRLVADTERVWRERGYAVQRDDNDPQVSIRRVIVNDYVMALYVNRIDKQGSLGVSSPCVRPPS
jgi:hypothetical protein